MDIKNSFQRIDDKFAYGTSLIMNRDISYTTAPIGDFLSRIWNLYGKPDFIAYEGFGYTLPIATSLARFKARKFISSLSQRADRSPWLFDI